jgi:vitamin B12 transporter
VDLGARLEAAGVRATAGVFRSDVSDLIQWAPSAAGRWSPHNVGQARLAGVEAEIAAERGLGRGWRLATTASGTWLHASDRTPGSSTAGLRLPRRADLWGGAAFDLHRDGWGCRIIVEGTSERYLNAANTKKLPPHATLGLELRGGFARGLSGSIEVRNLTDESYVDDADYPIPGREWSVRLHYAHAYGGDR